MNEDFEMLKRRLTRKELSFGQIAISKFTNWINVVFKWSFLVILPYFSVCFYTIEETLSFIRELSLFFLCFFVFFLRWQKFLSAKKGNIQVTVHSDVLCSFWRKCTVIRFLLNSGILPNIVNYILQFLVGCLSILGSNCTKKLYRNTESWEEWFFIVKIKS